MADVVVSLEVPQLDRSELLRYLGYRGQALDGMLESRLDEAEALCLEAARPRACLRTFEVASVEHAQGPSPAIALRGCALKLCGKDIVSHLAGARAVGLMAVTLGAGFERELRRRALLDAAAETLLDAAGTTAVEQAASQAERLLAAEAGQRGFHATWRFSPGYGDFPLETQRPLLAVLDAQRRLGISLTSSLLMIPTKSVTAVVGMVEGTPAHAKRGCEACSLRSRCSVRRAGRTCHD